MAFLRRNYLIIIFLLLAPVMYKRINIIPRSMIWSDTEGYYMYLPGLFVINDLHKLPEGSVWPQKNAQGEIILKYTCGVAIFEAPAFFITRAYCKAKGFNADDYVNIHYCRAMGISGYIFGFLGLFFLKKALLRRKFSEKTTFWTLLAVFFGTNLFHYITREPSMAHAYSFCLFAFVAWQTPRFLEKMNWQNALLLGVGLGWSILIRPTAALLFLFVLLYDVYDWKSLEARVRNLLAHWPQMLVAAAGVLLLLFPQMLYWHEMTGEWVRYSYTDEHFIYWKAPKILQVLFDVQNGLFLYSPMVLLMVLGVFWGIKDRREHGPVLLLIFAIATYLFASWWAWWFGGAFGHRCYVEYYALLAFPMALVFDKIFAVPSKALRVSLLVFIVFLMYYSVRLSLLYTTLPGPWDGKDWIWNWDKIKWVWSYLFWG